MQHAMLIAWCSVFVIPSIVVINTSCVLGKMPLALTMEEDETQNGRLKLVINVRVRREEVAFIHKGFWPL